jgi:hypothetical protein
VRFIALTAGAMTATLFAWPQRGKAHVLNRLRFRILWLGIAVTTDKLKAGSAAFPGPGNVARGRGQLPLP